jgi:hypothetical protein
MSEHAALPARYDHVGSFLRPQYLLEARAQRARGELTAEQGLNRGSGALACPGMQSHITRNSGPPRRGTGIGPDFLRQMATSEFI